jgi:carbonic anhydrase/acetyltransferase-like protein (isoleucine patch superfamily)
MNAGSAQTVVDANRDGLPQIASSAIVLGTATMGYNSGLSEGAIVRSRNGAVAIGTGSLVIENSVVVGSLEDPVAIGRRTVFGHRCLVIGATVGDLCEIGKA